MNLLDLTFLDPVENLAADEALLDACEERGEDGLLRFWEPQNYFVVVGYANRVTMETDPAACREAGVPVFRRCSGGGTVLQGPGCLNYSLVLKIDDYGPLATIPAANRFIMQRNAAALNALLKQRAAANFVEVAGHTDLVIAGRKFSGNAQRRRKRFLLFHGTFLLQFDLARMETLLRPPSQQPAYRANRPHGDFVMNLPLPADQVKAALRQAWRADVPLEEVPRETIASLARDKYATDAWNLKFW
jgi:lipoate---protein ligase